MKLVYFVGGICNSARTDAPRRFKWARSFRRKTKSGFCACAITFQLATNYGSFPD